MQNLHEKSFINVAYTTTDCKLSLTDRLVYSYLAWKDQWSGIPDNSSIARRLGMDRETVARSIARLTDIGFIIDGKVCLPDLEKTWFKYRKGNYDHWSQGFRFWTCYTRNTNIPDNPLTVHDICLWSFIQHSHQTHNGDWKISYLSKVLSMNRATVEAGLQRLKEAGFLEYKLNPLAIDLYDELLPEESALLLSADDLKTKGSGKVRVISKANKQPIESKCSPEVQKLGDLLYVTLDFKKLNDTDGCVKMIDEVMSQQDWQNCYQSALNDLPSELEPFEKRSMFLKLLRSNEDNNIMSSSSWKV
tara:strand:- start:2592 stop:3503 length:912 start_codon:yes stop_codon:yes gene_type:complete